MITERRPSYVRLQQNVTRRKGQCEYLRNKLLKARQEDEKANKFKELKETARVDRQEIDSLKEDGSWQLGSLTFSHLARPLKLTTNTTPPQSQH